MTILKYFLKFHLGDTPIVHFVPTAHYLSAPSMFSSRHETFCLIACFLFLKAALLRDTMAPSIVYTFSSHFLPNSKLLFHSPSLI